MTPLQMSRIPTLYSKLSTLNSRDITRRQGQLGLGLLLLFFLAWDLYAILADQQLGTDASDTTLVDYFHFQFTLRESSITDWLTSGNVKGPLATLLICLLEPLVGDWLIASRLLSVLAHGVLLWLVSRLVLRLSSRHLLGLVAVAICGSFPMEFGWFRMDFHDPLVATLVVAGLLAMLDGLDRPAAALRLGLVLGLGILTKLTFPMFLLFPGLLFLWRNLRSKRQLLNLVLAAGVVLLLISWWAIPTAALMQQYLTDSTGRYPAPPEFKLWLYLWELPGSPWLLGAALVGVLLAWHGRVARAVDLLALVLCMVPSILMLILVFDPWSRYIVPAYPVAGVLAALGLGPVLRRAARRIHWVRPLLLALLGLGLGAQYLWFNLVGGQQLHQNRIHRAGIVAPDTRPHDAYARAARTLRQNGWKALTVVSFHLALPELWHQRGIRAPELELPEALSDHQEGRPVYLLLPHPEPGERDPTTLIGENPVKGDEMITRKYAWIRAKRDSMKVVRRFSDPDGVSYFIIRIPPK